MDVAQGLKPIPPQSLRERVTGNSDQVWFDVSGERTVNEWARALASQGHVFGDFETIMDFGCGCGRALRHLIGRLIPAQTLIGLDPDAEAISWLSETYPSLSFNSSAELPPCEEIRSGSIDLVVSHSVFTHLPEDVQLIWLSELSRMLRPGGVLLVSIHGQKVVREYAASLLAMGNAEASTSFLNTMSQKRFFHVIGKNSYEGPLPSYYGAAFHDIAYIAAVWTQDFRIDAWFPGFALAHQDVILLTKT